MVPFDDTRISLWSGSINLGANFRKGNTNQNDANLRLQLQRSTALNRLKFDYIINKSKQGAVNESLEETTNNQRLNLNFDWFFSERLFLRPLQFEFYSDPFSNIDKRYTYGLGIGYRIIDFKKVTWHATAGPGYQHTRYTIATDDNANIVDSKALILSTTFDWEITNKIDFIFDYQIQLLEKEVGEVLQTLKTGFDIEIISDFEIDILLYVERNNNPQQIVSDLAFVKNDYQLMFSLGYEF
jgi:putative salt-induced outer membrane protein YdiY